jgi:hypothetical protein
MATPPESKGFGATGSETVISSIVEQEYQKRLPDHGIRVRPDIIIHIPTLVGGNRRLGNFAVFELNLRAGEIEAREDFANLDAVLGALDYPLGVFINIDSTHTQVASENASTSLLYGRRGTGFN